ncbi:hypothetical protein HOI83_03365 [Candidatus Uhrbacteria bacterium]|jgi:hypothetical protein|nr:hypothetical protein [Candidatus Uhrbacteria bacterium]
MNGRLRKREGHELAPEVIVPQISTEAPEDPPESYKEKRERLLDVLSARVEIFEGVYADIMALEPDMSSLTSHFHFDELVEKWTAQFPEAARKTLERAAVAKIENLPTNPLDPDFDPIANDAEATALQSVRELIMTMRRKYAVVDAMRIKPEHLQASVDRYLKHHKLNRTDLVRIDVNTTDVSLVFSEEVVLLNRKDVGGFHANDSVFLVTKDFGVHTANVVRHERIHNVMDGVKPISDRTLEPKKHFQDLARQSPDSHIQIDQETRDHYALKELNPIELFDSLHEEILAELEIAERKDFNRWWHTVPNEHGVIQADLSTAQRYVNEFVEFAEEKAAAGPRKTQAMQDQWQTVADGFKSRWNKMVSNLVETTTAARGVGPDATEFVHMAFVALKPSQYRHVNKLLERKYGKEVIDAGRVIASINNGQPQSLPELNNAFITLNLTPDEDQRKAVHNEAMYQAQHASALPDTDSVRKLLQDTDEIYATMGIEPLAEISIVAIWSDYLYERVVSVGFDDEVLDPALLDVDMSEKDIKQVVTEALQDVIFHEMADLETLSDLRHKPLWKIVTHYGLEYVAKHLFAERMAIDAEEKDAA